MEAERWSRKSLSPTTKKGAFFNNKSVCSIILDNKFKKNLSDQIEAEYDPSSNQLNPNSFLLQFKRQDSLESLSTEHFNSLERISRLKLNSNNFSNFSTIAELIKDPGYSEEKLQQLPSIKSTKDVLRAAQKSLDESNNMLNLVGS